MKSASAVILVTLAGCMGTGSDESAPSCSCEAVEGPQGPPGEPGQVGEVGPAGNVGPQGPAGPGGVQGPQGPTGAAGPQGLQGEDGADGAQGPPGGQGPQGVPGAPGADGFVDAAAVYTVVCSTFNSGTNVGCDAACNAGDISLGCGCGVPAAATGSMKSCGPIVAQPGEAPTGCAGRFALSSASTVTITATCVDI